jgi:catechol 2,3-dioxygenase-like lactoylglutathione lyase family enzyme
LPLIALVKDRHIFFRAGHSVLLCFLAEATKNEKELPPHGANGSIHFAFEVRKEDYQNVFTQIKNAGISVLREQQWKNGLHCIYFHDPDENLVEIIEQGLWNE